jgi:hypothetical protein
MILGQSHDPDMNLFNNLRSQSLRQPPQSLGIGHLLAPDPGELAIQQVAANCSFQLRKAPVPNVFQQQHPQHDFCGGAWSTMRAAPRMAALQGVMPNRQ